MIISVFKEPTTEQCGSEAVKLVYFAALQETGANFKLLVALQVFDRTIFGLAVVL